MAKKRKKTKKQFNVKRKKVSKKKGQNLNSGESLYSPELAARAKVVILTAQTLKSDGTLNYTQIGKLLDVPVRTFGEWRNVNSKYFKPELVQALTEALEELVEGLDSNKIKQSMIKRAQPYKRVKKFKELVLKGPKMPAMSSMNKAALLKCAKKLGLKVDKKDTNGELKLKITDEVQKQTKSSMVTVKQEEEQMHGDVSAAKLVLPNIGPKDKRWTGQQNINIESESLADIIAKAGIVKK